MKADEQPSPPPSRGWTDPVSSRNLVVIAASAGGFQAIRSVLSALPASFPAAFGVVQHRGDPDPERLPELLDQRTALKVRHARTGDLLEAGTVYLCPPGIHMTTEHVVRLIEGPRLDFVRPSANLMFRSAAQAYGDRAIGVVLSGSGSDGTAGCKAISEAGGMVVAQDPASSAHANMPAAALRSGRVDLVLPLDQIGAALQRLVEDSQAERGGARSPSPLEGAVSPRRIEVLLVDDHRIILDGLRALLGSESDINVVAQAEDGRTAVRLAGELSPDVVVMDIALPDLNGIDATRQIKARNPRTSVVALSARVDADSATRILKAGASRYLCKDAAFPDLARAIRSAFVHSPYPG
jgi:two-component system chemotaxis response regulator CheB